MKTLLTANLSTKTVTQGAEAWTPPEYVFGEALTLALRFTQAIDGQTVEPALDIRSMKAAIGVEDARPDSGAWALQVGPGPQTSTNTTELLQADCPASAVVAAINAVATITAIYGPAKVTKSDGSWSIVCGTGGVTVPMRIVRNTLWPASFGQISSYAVDGVWQQDVRLIQAPLALTDVGARVLPAPPTIVRVQAGGSGGGYKFNEIQQLTVPPDFRGTYIIKWGAYARTGELGNGDGSEAVQAALAKIFGDDVRVSDTAGYSGRIEFVNDLAGTPIDVLTVSALNPPAGDLTFSLPLDSEPLLTRLRRERVVEQPLELRIWTADANGIITPQVAFSVLVRIRRPVLWPSFALVPAIDYLRPLSPVDYVPFNQLSVITGQQFFRAVVGNATARIFAITDGLATDDKFVLVRENTSSGRQLVHGTDFTAYIVDANSVQVNVLGTTPALNTWVVTIISAQTVGAFANGLEIEIGQVNGLQALLDAIGGTLADVLALIPTTPLGTTRKPGEIVATIELPSFAEIIPGPARGQAFDRNKLPKGNALLPALHDASVTLASGTLPDAAAYADSVFLVPDNTTFQLPNFGGHLSFVAEEGATVGSDGRSWFPVEIAPGTTSYFPLRYQRLLHSFEVNADMLRAGTTLTFEVTVALQLLAATCRASYAFVIEHGTITSQATPGTTAPNLQAIVWNATPLLQRRVTIDEAKVPHSFGVEIIRGGNGVLAANKVLYGLATAAGSVPTSADLALRARLINFDTENADSNPRGTVLIEVTAKAEIK